MHAEYISRNDPDVVVGYDFGQLDLDVLLNRLRELKVDNWSRVGRLRVKSDKWPVLRAGRNTGLLGGRLLVDLTSDGCKVRSRPPSTASLRPPDSFARRSQAFIDSNTWSLTEMSEKHLNIARDDLDPEDTPKFFDSVHSTAKQLMQFVMHCLADCFLQMAIATKVQALPLTRQLTNLAGNCWCVTLSLDPLVALPIDRC